MELWDYGHFYYTKKTTDRSLKLPPESDRKACARLLIFRQSCAPFIQPLYRERLTVNISEPYVLGFRLHSFIQRG